MRRVGKFLKERVFAPSTMHEKIRERVQVFDFRDLTKIGGDQSAQIGAVLGRRWARCEQWTESMDLAFNDRSDAMLKKFSTRSKLPELFPGTMENTIANLTESVFNTIVFARPMNRPAASALVVPDWGSPNQLKNYDRCFWTRVWGMESFNSEQAHALYCIELKLKFCFRKSNIDPKAFSCFVTSTSWMKWPSWGPNAIQIKKANG
eukprot:GABV01009005.1.p2 GENE.GABV01009005.1~~GABV01009005.1.p2  ORF type:complete len:214 (-),score=60.80 GABV01009005.1:215-832(-)